MDLKYKKRKGWYTVFLNALIGCCISATFPQFSMVTSDLAVASGISESILLISDTVKSCGIVISMVCSGFLYNKLGARHLFVLAILAAVLPQFVIPKLTSPGFLMVLKFIQGASAVIFPVFLVIIMNWMDKKSIGLSTAIFNGIFYGGGGIGGTFAGFVISKSNWIISFYAIAFIQIILGLLWLATIKESPENQDNSHREETLEPKNDKKSNLLFTGKVWLLAISFLATTWTVQAITVDMSLFSNALGYNEEETGALLTAVTMAMLFSCLVSGRTSDYFAGKKQNRGIARLSVLLFGYIVVAISVLFIICLDMSNLTSFYIGIFLITFGGSWGLGTFYSIIPELYGEKSVPIVTGITGGIGDSSMPVSPLIVGVIFGFNGMWNMAWGTCIIISLIGIASILILIHSLKKNSDKGMDAEKEM